MVLMQKKESPENLVVSVAMLPAHKAMLSLTIRYAEYSQVQNFETKPSRNDGWKLQLLPRTRCIAR